ncbi:MAG: hypothetical protein KatS3mg115_1964 [Candidatus Poribacteria bacterium]|nr:MAG: hypothetical protein KatS3mg115_1964 [Candidatus Poribacteria bacterium]
MDRAVREYIPPRSQPTHLQAILTALESAPAGKETALSRGLEELSHRLVRRGLIVLLSDLLDEPQEVLRALRLLRHRKHEVVVFHLLSPEEMDFPFREPVVVRDVETGETLTSGGNLVRRRYREVVEAFLEQYKKGCAAHGVDYVLMRTDTPFDLALAAYLSRRKR